MNGGAGVPLAHRLAHQINRLVPSDASCLVAVSGGPDSLALLDLAHLAQEGHGRPLIVGHVDHGISPASAEVGCVVREAATARELPFLIRMPGLGPDTSETRARTARRDALRSMAVECGAAVVLLAHHADDQAETVLLRLLRGSGPAGLAGMAMRRGIWVRPLLQVRRAELAEHLVARRLSAWTDPANSDPRHLRSWLRSTIVPSVQQRLPDLVERLSGAARQAANDRAAWHELLPLLAGLDTQQRGRGISVAAPILRGYRSPLRRAVVAAIGRQLGGRLGARRLAAVERLLAGEATGGTIDLSRRIRAELAFGRLALYRIDETALSAVALRPGSATVFGGAEFRVLSGNASATPRDGWRASIVAGEYRVREWRAGDRIRPLGGSGSRAVSVLLREARVPPSRRRRWPIVVTKDDATIVWVPGICRSDAVLPTDGIEAWSVECIVAGDEAPGWRP